ncbi:hypothetical protein Tco_0886053 [Tanacetum coccineum]
MSSLNAPLPVNNVTSPNTTLNPLAFHTSPSTFYSILSSPPGFPINPSAQTVRTQPTYNLGQPAHNLGQPTSYAQPSQQDRVGQSGQSTTGQQFGQLSGQENTLPHVFNALMIQDPSTSNWNIDTVLVGDGYSIPVTNYGYSIFPTPHRPLPLNNVLITPNIVKNLIYVRQFVRDNYCIGEFDAFSFSVKDFITRRVLLRCDSTGDLYPLTKSSPIPYVFLTSQYTWHQRLENP